MLRHYMSEVEGLSKEELDLMLTKEYRRGYKEGYDECLFDCSVESPLTKESWQDKMSNILASDEEAKITVISAEETDPNNWLFRIGFDD